MIRHNEYIAYNNFIQINDFDRCYKALNDKLLIILKAMG